MRIVDRYVLRQCLVPIAATIIIGLLVLSAARFLIFFDLVLGNEKGLEVVLQLFAAFIPHYLAFMLPLAVYWGSYTAVRQLALGSEVMVLQATGTSIARIFSVLIVLGVIFACINVAVVGWMQPLGRYTYRSLTHQLEQTGFYLRVRDATFMEVGTRTVFVENIDRDRHGFEHILVFETLDNGDTITIVAPRGTVGKDTGQVTLRLYDGQRRLIESGAGPPQIMDFKVIDVPIGDESSPFRPRGEDELELLLPELMVQNGPLADATLPEISTELHKKLVIALSCAFLPMLAVSLGLQNRRRKNFYQAPAALLVVILYHQLVEFSSDIGENMRLGPAFTLWLTYGVFFTISAVLFYRVTRSVGSIGDRIAAAGGGLHFGFGSLQLPAPLLKRRPP